MSIKNPIIMRIICICSICFILLLGCDPVDKKFMIRNKSSNTISFYIAKDSSFNLALNYFSDTLQDYPYIQPNKTYKIPILSNWELYISHEFKDSTLNVFFIDSLSISMNNKIDLNKRIKRYRVTLKEIKKQNWILQFE